MTYTAYIENIKKQTGKDPEDFMQAAKKKGIIKDGKIVEKTGKVVAWLKSDFGLGYGHAMSIVMYLQNPEFAKKKMAQEAEAKKRSNK